MSDLLVVTDEDGLLRAMQFGDLESRMSRQLRDHYGAITLQDGAAPASLTRKLDAYFNGEILAIDDIQTATAGTAFQRAVWEGLRTIPAGETISYGQFAAQIGRPGSARAVGAAVGANPIPIVVPCHRVIGADGSLTGFGCGLPRKRWLLDHESRYAGTTLLAASLATV